MKKEDNRGIIYVDVKKPSEFGETFANAIGFNVEKSPLHFLGEWTLFGSMRQSVKSADVETQVNTCLRHLERVLTKMKEQRKHKQQAKDEKQLTNQKLPVIIIDNCNRLTEMQPEMLKSLQYTAKDWIDAQLALFVFVTSEGKTETIMRGRGVSSRMETLRIHELNRQNAIEFLKSRKIPKEDAESIERSIVGSWKNIVQRKKCLSFNSMSRNSIMKEILLGFPLAEEKRNSSHFEM